MSFRIGSTALRQIIKPVISVRDGGECRVDVNSDSIRLRSRSVDSTAWFDYRFSIPSAQELSTDVTGTFYIELETIDGILRAVSEDITITLPMETNDGRIVIQSDGLTSRIAPIDDRGEDYAFNGSSQNPTTTFTIQHGEFDHSVQVTNLVGQKMTFDISGKTHYVTFSGGGRIIEDSFRYSVPVEQIELGPESTRNLSVSIDKLKNITPHIPSTTTTCVEVTSDYLTYRADNPYLAAELTLYIASWQDAI